MRSSKSYQRIHDAMTAQIDETKVANPAAAFEKRMNELREELVEVRGELANFLPEHWKKQFRNVQTVIYKYVHLLSIYSPQFYIIWGDLSVDLNLLKELKAKLEDSYHEAVKNYDNLEYTHLYALTKRAMMLQQLQFDLDSVNPPAFPIGEIPRLRELLDEVDWKEILECVDRRKGVLSRDPAKNNDKEVQSLEQIINCGPINLHNPVDQFKEYEEEECKAATEMEENFAVYCYALPVCKLVKLILSQLEKVDEECQEVDRSVQPDDGAKSGQPVLKKQKH